MGNKKIEKLLDKGEKEYRKYQNANFREANRYLNKVLKILDEILRIEPGNKIAFDKIIAIARKNQFKYRPTIAEVIKYCESMLSQHPKDENALFTLGILLAEDTDYLQHLKKAESCLSKVVELNPKNIDAWFKLGGLYYPNYAALEMENVDRCIECFEKVIEIDSKCKKALIILAYLYEEKNEFGEAIRYISMTDISFEFAWKDDILKEMEGKLRSQVGLVKKDIFNIDKSLAMLIKLYNDSYQISGMGFNIRETIMHIFDTISLLNPSIITPIISELISLKEKGDDLFNIFDNII
ncbi:MAG: tetratricopeptide repeat protein, partial [Promethearchaeota archaeon]